MKLKVIITYGLGIAIMDMNSGEIYESGYESIKEAEKALRNFKKMYA